MLFRAMVVALCVAGTTEAAVTAATVAANDVCSNDEWSYLCNKDSWAGAADAVTGGKELLTAGLRRAMDHIAAETDCAATDTECIEAKAIVDAQTLQIPDVIDSKQLKQVSDASGVLHPASDGMYWKTTETLLGGKTDGTDDTTLDDFTLTAYATTAGFPVGTLVAIEKTDGTGADGGVPANQAFYVVAGADANTFSVSLVPGGADVQFQGASLGTGTLRMYKLEKYTEAYYVGDTLPIAINTNEAVGSDYIDDIALTKWVDASLPNGCDREPHHDIKSSAHVQVASGTGYCTTHAQYDLQGRKACQTAGGTYDPPKSVGVSFGYINYRVKSGSSSTVYTGTDSATTTVYSTTDHSDIAKTRADTCGTAKDSCGTTLTGAAATNGGWGDVADPSATTFRLCMTSPAISDNKVFADTGLTVKARCGYVSATKYENAYDENTEWALTMAPQTGAPGNGAADADHEKYYRCMCKANYYREADASSANFGKCVQCGSSDDGSHMFRSVVGDGAHATTVAAGTPDNNGACAKCPAGRVDMGTMSTSTSSTVATDGEACTLNTAFSTDCQQCPQYTFRATIGGVHANDCAVCGAGKYAKFDAAKGATCEADVCVDECGANDAGAAVWGYRPDQTHTASNTAVHTAADTLGSFTDTQAIAKCVTTCPADKPKHDPVSKTCVAVCPWGTESATVGGVANVCQPIKCAENYRATGASVGTSALGGELVSIALSDITTNVACVNGGPYAVGAADVVEAAGTNTDVNAAGALFGAGTTLQVYCTESIITSVVVTNGGTGHKVGNTLALTLPGTATQPAPLAATLSTATVGAMTGTNTGLSTGTVVPVATVTATNPTTVQTTQEGAAGVGTGAVLSLTIGGAGAVTAVAATTSGTGYYAGNKFAVSNIPTGTAFTVASLRTAQTTVVTATGNHNLGATCQKVVYLQGTGTTALAAMPYGSVRYIKKTATGNPTDDTDFTVHTNDDCSSPAVVVDGTDADDVVANELFVPVSATPLEITLAAGDLNPGAAEVTLSSASLRPQVGSPVYTTKHVLTGGNHMLPNHVVTAGDCNAAATATDGMTRATFQLAVDCDTTTNGDQACIDQITFAAMAPGLGVGSVIRFTQAAVEACDKITPLTTGTDNGNTNTGAFYTGFSYTLGEGDFTPLCEQCKNGQNTNSLRHYVFSKNTVPNAGASTYDTTGETGHGTTFANNLATVDSPSALVSAWTTFTGLPSANYAANVFADVSTQCMMSYCQADDQYVDNHACVDCPTGKYNRQTVPVGSSTGGIVSMLPAGVSNVIEVATVANNDEVTATENHGLAAGVCYRATFQNAAGNAPTNIADGATVHLKRKDADEVYVHAVSDADCTGTAVVIEGATDNVDDGDTFTIGHGLDATTAAGAASCYTATYVDGDSTAHAVTTMSNGATVYAKSAGAASFNLFSDNACANAIASDDGASGGLKTSDNLATAPTAPTGFTAADATYLIPATSISTSGSGTGGAFSITVTGGNNVVGSAIATTAGSGYSNGDTLTVSAASLNAIAGISGATADLTVTLANADITGAGEDVEAGDSFTFRVRNSMAVDDNMASACLAQSCADGEYLSAVGASWACTTCGSTKSNAHGSLPSTYKAAPGDVLTVVSQADPVIVTVTAAHGMAAAGCYEATFTNLGGSAPTNLPDGATCYLKQQGATTFTVHIDVGCLTSAMDESADAVDLAAGDTFTLTSGARIGTEDTAQGTSGDVITLPGARLNTDRTVISYGQMIKLHTSVLKQDVKSTLATAFTGCTTAAGNTGNSIDVVAAGAVTTANPKATGMLVKLTSSTTANAIDQIQFSHVTAGDAKGYQIGDVVTLDAASINNADGGISGCTGSFSYTLRASDFLSVETATKTLTASSADPTANKVIADAVHGLLEGYCYEATFKDFDGDAITDLADATTVYVKRDSTSTTDFKVYSNADCSTPIVLPSGTDESVEQYDEFQVAKKDLENGDVFFVRYVSTSTFQLEDEYGMVVDLDDDDANGKYTSWEPIMTDSAMDVAQQSARLNICRPQMCAQDEFSDNDGTCTKCDAGKVLVDPTTTGVDDSQTGTDDSLDEGGLVLSGVLAVGGTNTATLPDSASGISGAYDGMTFTVGSQNSVISSYVGGTRIVTLATTLTAFGNNAAFSISSARPSASASCKRVGFCAANQYVDDDDARTCRNCPAGKSNAARHPRDGALATVGIASCTVNKCLRKLETGALRTTADLAGAVANGGADLAGANGAYEFTTFTSNSGTGTGATLQITVNTNDITAAETKFTAAGSGYKVGDILTLDAAALAATFGAGSNGGDGFSYTLVAADFASVENSDYNPAFVDANNADDPKTVAGCAFGVSGQTTSLTVGKVLTVANNGVTNSAVANFPDVITATTATGLTAGACTMAKFSRVTAGAVATNIADNQIVYLLAFTASTHQVTATDVSADVDVYKKFHVFSDSDCRLPISVTDGSGGSDVDVSPTDQFVVGGVTSSQSTDGQTLASFTLTFDDTSSTFTAITFSAGTGYAANTVLTVPSAALNGAHAQISGCSGDLTYTIRASDLGSYQRVAGTSCSACAKGEKVAVDGSETSSATAATTCEPVETCGADMYRKDNTCTACPRGTTRPARMATTVGAADENAADVCTPWTCAHNENLVNNECTPCQTGTNSWVEPVLTVRAATTTTISATADHGLAYDRCYAATYLDSDTSNGATAFNGNGAQTMPNPVYLKRDAYSMRDFKIYTDNTCGTALNPTDANNDGNDVKAGEMFMGLRLWTSGAVVANELVFAADHMLPENTPVYFGRSGQTDIPELCDMSSNAKALAKIKSTRVLTVDSSTHATLDTVATATPHGLYNGMCYKARYVDSDGTPHATTATMVDTTTVYLKQNTDSVTFSVYSDPNCVTAIDIVDATNPSDGNDVSGGDQFVVEGHSDDSECNEIYYTRPGSTGRRLTLSRTSGGAALDLTGGAANNLIGVVVGPTTSTDPNSPATDNKCEPIVCNDNCKVTNSQCVICDANNPLSDAKEGNPGGATYYVSSTDASAPTIGTHSLDASVCIPARFFGTGATNEGINDKAAVYIMKAAATTISVYADPSCYKIMDTTNIAVGDRFVTSDFLGPYPAWVDSRTLTVDTITDATTDLVHTTTPHGFAEGICYKATFTNAAGADPAAISNGATVHLKKADITFPLSLSERTFGTAVSLTNCGFAATAPSVIMDCSTTGVTCTTAGGANVKFRLTSTATHITKIVFLQGHGYSAGDTISFNNAALVTALTAADSGGTCSATWTYTFVAADMDLASVKPAFAVYGGSDTTCTGTALSLGDLDTASSADGTNTVDTFTVLASKPSNFDSANGANSADRNCHWNDCTTSRAPLTATSALSAADNVYGANEATCELCNAGRRRKYLTRAFKTTPLALDTPVTPTTLTGLVVNTMPEHAFGSTGITGTAGGTAGGKFRLISSTTAITGIQFTAGTGYLPGQSITIAAAQVKAMTGGTGGTATYTYTLRDTDFESEAASGIVLTVDSVTNDGYAANKDTATTASAHNLDPGVCYAGRYVDGDNDAHAVLSDTATYYVRAIDSKTFGVFTDAHCATWAALCDGPCEAANNDVEANDKFILDTTQGATGTASSRDANALSLQKTGNDNPANEAAACESEGFCRSGHWKVGLTGRSTVSDTSSTNNGDNEELGQYADLNTRNHECKSCPTGKSMQKSSTVKILTVSSLVDGNANADTVSTATDDPHGLTDGTCYKARYIDASAEEGKLHTSTAYSVTPVGATSGAAPAGFAANTAGATADFQLPMTGAAPVTYSGGNAASGIGITITVNGGTDTITAVKFTDLPGSSNTGYAVGETFTCTKECLEAATASAGNTIDTGATSTTTTNVWTYQITTGDLEHALGQPGEVLHSTASVFVKSVTSNARNFQVFSDATCTTKIELADENDGAALVAQGNDVDANDLFILDSVRGGDSAFNAGIAGCEANTCGLHMWPKLNGECAKCAAGKFRYNIDFVTAGDGLAGVTSARGFASGLVSAVAATAADRDSVFMLGTYASSVDNFYNGMDITVGTKGTRTIVDYDGETRQVTLSTPLTSDAAVNDAYEIDPCINACPENHKMTNGECVACEAGKVREAGDAMCLSAVVLTVASVSAGDVVTATKDHGLPTTGTTCLLAQFEDAADANTKYIADEGYVLIKFVNGDADGFTVHALADTSCATALDVSDAGGAALAVAAGDTFTVQSCRHKTGEAHHTSASTAAQHRVGADTLCRAEKCPKDHYVSSHKCVRCPYGQINAAGDDASGGDTTCAAASYCLPNQYVVSATVLGRTTLTCTDCPVPGTSSPALALTKANADKGVGVCHPMVCRADHYVSNNRCVLCAAGKTRPAGDDARGGNTNCNDPADAQYCAVDQAVISDGNGGFTCTACPSYTEAPLDSAGRGKPRTQASECTAILCLENYHVVNHICTACPAGKSKPAGDNSYLQKNTDCIVDGTHDLLPTHEKCQVNEKVVNHACVACGNDADGNALYAPAGADPAGPDTYCTAATPVAEAHTTMAVCKATTGTIADNDVQITAHGFTDGQIVYYWANGGTAVDGILEYKTYLKIAADHGNEFSLELRSGSGELTITGGATADPRNIFCQAGDLCPADYHVASHLCKPCALYYENAAGDDVHHQDTACTKKMCTAGQYVNDRNCVTCPPGTYSSPAWMGGPNTHCH